MPHLTLSFSQGAPIIDLFITASEARIVALKAAGHPVPDPQPIRGLIDTGASHTCIDPSVFALLHLSPTGNVPMLTASTGSVPPTTDTNDVGIFIPSGPREGLVLANIQVSSCDLSVAQNFQALIGRDILARCILVYSGASQTLSLSY